MPGTNFMNSGNMRKDSINVGQEYAGILRTKLGSRLRQVILFGSQARSSAGEESDYDVVVVVDKRTPEIREAVLDAGAEMMNKYEALFAAMIYSEKEWSEAQSFPLAWNIRQEGIAL
jgi:predicted nucleotidyltransferase